MALFPNPEGIKDTIRELGAKQAEMLCPCGYQGDHCSASLRGGSIIMWIEGKSIGSVDLHVCPKCGTLRTDAGGNIRL